MKIRQSFNVTCSTFLRHGVPPATELKFLQFKVIMNFPCASTIKPILNMHASIILIKNASEYIFYFWNSTVANKRQQNQI